MKLVLPSDFPNTPPKGEVLSFPHQYTGMKEEVRPMRSKLHLLE